MLNSSTPIMAGVEWTGMDMLDADFVIADDSTPIPQTPLSGISEVPSSAVNNTQSWIDLDLPNALNQEIGLYPSGYLFVFTLFLDANVSPGEQMLGKLLDEANGWQLH